MHTIPIIDFKKVAHAQEYYAGLGYTELSVPWIISFEPHDATRPPHRREFYCLGGYLNASGEQSFLELMLSGSHLKKHFCITPCFRDEPELDAYHHQYFLKLELIWTDVSLQHLHQMIADANDFLSRYTETDIIPTNDSGTAFDIIDRKSGVEFGSYGIRSYENYSWIYGTGIALPRLDSVISNNHSINNNHSSYV